MEGKDWKMIEEQLLLRRSSPSNNKNNIPSDEKIIPNIDSLQLLMNQILSGDYLNYLKTFENTSLQHSELIDAIQTEGDDLFLAFKTFILIYLTDDEGDNEGENSLNLRIFKVFLLAITYLELYIQANYTGPEFNRQEYNFLEGTKANNGEIKKLSLFQLECDGSFAHNTCIELPFLLLFARYFLSLLSDPTRASWKMGITMDEKGEIHSKKLEISQQFHSEITSSFAKFFPSLVWWNARACVFHTRLLVKQSYDTVPTLWNECCSNFRFLLLQYGFADSKDYDLLKSTEPILTIDEGLTVNQRMLASQVWLEWGLACHHFNYQREKNNVKFKLSKNFIHLEIYLTAALGRRTKYQRENIAQLLLYAKSSLIPQDTSLPAAANALPNNNDNSQNELSRPHVIEQVHKMNLSKEETNEENNESDKAQQDEHQKVQYEIGRSTIQATETGEEIAVREILLDDIDTGAAENIILEGGPHFEDSSNNNNRNKGSSNGTNGTSTVDTGGLLHPLDQCIILAYCMNVSNTNPIDGLTNEEMLPYIERILHSRQSNEQRTNWMIYSSGLLERSWIEYERRKTADRALLQLQALIDQHSTKLTMMQSSFQSISTEQSAKNAERLSSIYQLIYPSQFEMKLDLATRYLKMQVFQSALQLFRELECWDEIVACYQLMNKPHKAELVVREQLQKQGNEPTPYMITALADLTNSEALYEKAWTVSRERYPRAKRTLAKLCYDRGDFQQCIQHMNQALKIQPLIPTAWYLKGVACMAIEKWEEGIQSFVRCIHLEEEIGEAWTNLAAIYMRINKWSKAYQSLIEAVKHKGEDFRVLENMLTVCLKLEKWQESILQMDRLIDLRFKSHSKLTTNGSGKDSSGYSSIHYQELRYLAKVLPSLQSKYRETGTVDDEEKPIATIVGFEVNHDQTGKEHSEQQQLTAQQTEKRKQEMELNKIRYENIITSFDKLLNKIVLTLRSDPDICEIIADFNKELKKYRIEYDYRVKQIRAIINEAGWEKKESKVNNLANASVQLSEVLLQQDLKKEDVFTSKMLIQSCIRKLDKDQSFSDPTEETLKKVVTDIEKLNSK